MEQKEYRERLWKSIQDKVTNNGGGWDKIVAVLFVLAGEKYRVDAVMNTGITNLAVALPVFSLFCELLLVEEEGEEFHDDLISGKYAGAHELALMCGSYVNKNTLDNTMSEVAYIFTTMEDHREHIGSLLSFMVGYLLSYE